MKKTMFITSVIMVVVMAIALTTSSLAWFSAAGATSVTTSSLTLKAATNSSTGLLLGNSSSSFSTTAVYPTAATGSATQVSGEVTGMRPVGIYGESVLEALAKNQFCGRYVETSTGAAKWSNEVAQYNDHFAGYVYVANTGNAETTVTATVNFGTVTGATLYVAVLATVDPDDDTAFGTLDADDWEILTVACSNDGTSTEPTQLPLAASAFTVGNTVASTFTNTSIGANTGAETTTAIGEAADNVAYSHYQQFMVLAWYSADLVANNSGATATHGSFTVTFALPA